ncbi:hypothetical protein KKD03_02755 [Patescibacteria group bacterium]|nr:hypothetical protein [Patescibacteria group bacterium]
MNIYFTASARASIEIKQNYQMIFDSIRKLDHKNIDNWKINTNPHNFYSATDDHKSEVYSNALELIKKSDLVILEVSTHSLTMGYLIKYALDIKIPVIALHTSKHEPGFIIGIEDENFQLIEYAPNSIKITLQKAIKFAGNTGDIRFNMMLSPKLSTYLKEASDTENVSKAVFIRRLIKEYRNKQISNITPATK